MDELGRLLLLIGIVGVSLTALGVVSAWWMEEGRRVRRGLKRILGTEPQALLLAPGRGKGAAFDFGAGKLAVAWDSGGWGLAYRLDELTGAELILDNMVVGRVHRGEPRRAVDSIGGAEGQVRLRLLFADIRWPDFDLDLWRAGDEAGKHGITATDAIQEANRWLARVDAVLRQPAASRPAPPVAQLDAQPQVQQPSPAPPPPLPAEPRRAAPERDLDEDDDPYDDPPF